MKRILIAEDEKNIRDLVVFNLTRNGYEVFEADNGTAALELYNKYRGNFDIALLDIMMPGIDGLELCEILRKKNSMLGIVLLTAKSQEMDKVTGLLTGADDYITKPFSVSELMARIDAVYRRVSVNRSGVTVIPTDNERITHGKFALNLRSRALEFENSVIELTQIEFRIVQAFFEAPEYSLGRGELLHKVWGENFYGDDKVVDVNIRRLRIKIEPNPSEPRYLVTVWGLGYRWNGE